MDVRTGFFAFLLVLLGAVTAMMIAPLFQYIIAACLLAFVCYPAHRRLEERVGPRVSALLLTAFAVVAAVVPLLAFSIVIFDTVFSFLNDFDELAAIETVRELALELGVEQETIDSVETHLVTELEMFLSESVEFVLAELITLVNTTIEMALGLMVLLFLLYYLLVDGPEFVAWVSSIAPLEVDIREELFDEVETVTWAVIYSHVLVALVEGILGGIGLWLLGVPNVTFWTVVMIIVSFLPAVGIWLVWGPAVGYLFVAGEPVSAAILLVYGIAVLSVVDNYLRAIFVDRESGLHPAVVLVGVIGGIYLLGIMGLFLGPVLLAVFKAGLNVFGDAYGDFGSSSTTESVEPSSESSATPPSDVAGE
ncbi:AI-2E family transporter [Halostagnicola sp. A-GB9-2]|uniref:AI-2E family transporter n=1 Tax=Halostagnicola sp. A-GB9-2 TaxID=3048066 RepID=UPI0024C0BCCA|nr:AI-2E family transporter [Halostagnicola sp. A-GB9-2]MDJ1431768.1 AI-2E family transporter [Halostagnicola sp. A-GB9-2]